MKYLYIRTEKELRSYLQNYKEKKYHTIALDIEAELNRHAYGETLCLIQIFDGSQKALIDPLQINNGTLRLLFEKPYIRQPNQFTCRTWNH